jgi:hypothetical protein
VGDVTTYSVEKTGPARWYITEYSAGGFARQRTFTNWFSVQAAVFKLWTSGARRVS